MEKQLEALNINDSFESDQESSHPKIIRTFSFPSNQTYFKASKELQSLKLDRHHSEQILYPNIETRTKQPTILSEMQARKTKTDYIYDNVKVPKHFWHPKIDKKPSIPVFTSADDQMEYMKVEKYPDSPKYIHDTISSTSAPMQAVNQTEVMEVEKYMDTMNPMECVLSKPTSMKPLFFGAAIKQRHTSMSKSTFILESQPLKMKEDFAKLIPMKQKLRKTKIQKNNSDYTNENDNKKQTNEDNKKNYQDTKKEICLKIVSKVKQALCIFFLVILLIFVFLFVITLYEDQDDKHSNTFAITVVELKKQIIGQSKAIEILTNYLQQDLPLLKVIALVGGTGVGKTYTVEIIRKNFHEKNINRFFSLHADLVILDNLKEEHLLDVINFVKTHQKTYGNRYSTILAVFNFEHMSDNSTRSIDLNKSINTIKNNFSDANLDIKIIPYEPLSEDALEKCIMNTAKIIQLTLSQNQIALIKQQLIENNAGCKGAYGKIQVIGRQ